VVKKFLCGNWNSRSWK